MNAARARGLLAAGFIVALVVVFWITWRLGEGRLLGIDPAQAKLESTARAVLLDVRSRRERKPAQDKQLAAIVDRTLGGTLAEVDSALRARLNRLGESEKLRELAVGTAANTVRESPAKSRYGRDADQRILRDEPDFIELQGWITGEGTPVQVLRMLQRVDDEPWLKRIDGVRLEAVRGAKPTDPTRLRANIRLTTIFMPGREPTTQLASTWSADDVKRLAPLVTESLFAMPAAPQPTAAAAAPSPPPTAPPTFPYDEWMLTGVARGPAGMEAWLHNRRSGEHRVLAAGEALHEMVFADAAGESARFTFATQRVAVAVGHSMNERTPVQ